MAVQQKIFETFLGSFLSKGKDEPSKKMKSYSLFYIGRNKKERRKEVLLTILHRKNQVRRKEALLTILHRTK